MLITCASLSDVIRPDTTELVFDPAEYFVRKCSKDAPNIRTLTFWAITRDPIVARCVPDLSSTALASFLVEHVYNYTAGSTF